MWMEAVKSKKEELQKDIDGRLYLALKEREEGVVERARGDHLQDLESIIFCFLRLYKEFSGISELDNFCFVQMIKGVTMNFYKC